MWGSSHKLAKRVRRRFPNGGISTTYLGYIWKRVEVNLMLLVVVVIWLGSSVGGCKGCGMRPHTR
jgi:hypothetical protein